MAGETGTDGGTLPLYPGVRTCPFSAPDYDVFARGEEGLREVRHPTGLRSYMLTRFDDVRAALVDPRFSAEWREPGFPHTSPAAIEMQGGVFLRTDDPYHAKVRRILLPEFSVKAAKALQPRLEEIVDRQIDHLVAQQEPADFIEHFALPIPSAAICIILGVPIEERAIFEHSTAVVVDHHTSREAKVAAWANLKSYMADLIERKMKAPRVDDLLSRVAHDFVAPGEMTVAEFAAAAATLVGAGHETTANQITLSALSLILHPAELERMQRSDSINSAVEELLRYWSIVQFDPRRVAIEDVELAGHVIRKGESIITSLPAANRDPSQFAETGDPEMIDVCREARQQVAFGYGVHQCLGQNLARMELRTVYARLFPRLPNLRLAVPVEELVFNRDRHVYGVHELPVAWS